MNKTWFHIFLIGGLLLFVLPSSGCDSDADLILGTDENLEDLDFSLWGNSGSDDNEGSLSEYAGGINKTRDLAQAGDASAQYDLGQKYELGESVPQDYEEAMRWYRLAAEQGHVVAQTEIGVLYSKGYGVPKDYVQAHMWLSLAGLHGNEDAIRRRGSLEGKMTPAQIAEAQGLARMWKPRPRSGV